ncbi:MAG TPA: mechanosensitive ion channel family protein [Kofleriaceae bacterium]|nr:mechanosensitive ion channel family protein [Kofleriaceae bacterium]
MHFWSVLAEQLWTARTPYVVVAYLLTRALINGTRVERYHLRAAATLVISHVVALAIGAGQTAFGYQSHVAETTSFAFEALAGMSIGVTMVFRALLPRVGFTLPRILLDLLTAFGVIVVFIAVGRRAGFSVAGLITTSAVVTAVIGFSLQDTLGNVMGGLSLQLDKSIAVGDWISLGPGQPSGQVTEIRWRYTAIELRTWDTVIIPNGMLVKSQITILGRRTGAPQRTRRHIEFFVDFRWSPSEVIETVEAALQKDPVPRMALDPAPNVVMMGVRDSYAQYIARYWLTDLAVDDQTDSAVRTRIWFALRRAGISLSIPATSIFLTHETPERETRKAEREIEQRLRALKKVDLFSGLSAKLQRQLADQLELAPFARGEAITREGEQDDGLYMIVEGDAVVQIGHADQSIRAVAQLGPGQFFGEMSLMTGEARTATVVAATDILCYRIQKAAFQEILQETPAIADQIAEVLAMRRTALSAARDERDEVRKKRHETAKQDLLGRIRGFFGLDASR